MAFRNSLNENENNEKNRQLLYLRNSFAAAGNNKVHSIWYVTRYEYD